MAAKSNAIVLVINSSRFLGQRGNWTNRREHTERCVSHITSSCHTYLAENSEERANKDIGIALSSNDKGGSHEPVGLAMAHAAVMSRRT